MVVGLEVVGGIQALLQVQDLVNHIFHLVAAALANDRAQLISGELLHFDGSLFDTIAQRPQAVVQLVPRAVVRARAAHTRAKRAVGARGEGGGAVGGDAQRVQHHVRAGRTLLRADAAVAVVLLVVVVVVADAVVVVVVVASVHAAVLVTVVIVVVVVVQFDLVDGGAALLDARQAAQVLPLADLDDVGGHGCGGRLGGRGRRAGGLGGWEGSSEGTTAPPRHRLCDHWCQTDSSRPSDCTRKHARPGGWVKVTDTGAHVRSTFTKQMLLDRPTHGLKLHAPKRLSLSSNSFRAGYSARGSAPRRGTVRRGRG